MGETILPDGREEGPVVRRDAPLTMARRRELIALADRFVTEATAAGVAGREWCFLRKAAELYAGRWDT